MTCSASVDGIGIRDSRWNKKAAALVGTLVLAMLLPVRASAEPVTLKLAFPNSDQTEAYLAIAKPFVDEVNRRGADLVKIEVYFSGALNRVPAQQAQLVLDGKADIAFVVPSLMPDLFRDNAVVTLPGLFRNVREASLAHTRLVASNALRGYERFFVIGAVATEPEAFHSRKPLASLADVKGQTLRVNNSAQAAVLSKLGGSSAIIAANQMSEAISTGKVDGAILQSAQLADFGMRRFTTNHYLLGTGSAPLALLMNRSSFDALPEAAKNLIGVYSGEWLANRYAAISEAANAKVIDEFKAEPRRNVVSPSPAEREESERIFSAVVEEWAAQNPLNRELLTRARAEIAKLRSPN